MSRRIINHPVLEKIDESLLVNFTFNNKTYQGFEHESVAAALIANGIRTLRLHEESATPRGIYCNIGHCFECRVTVNGKQGIRACLTPVAEGLDVKSGEKLLTDVKDWRHEND